MKSRRARSRGCGLGFARSRGAEGLPRLLLATLVLLVSASAAAHDTGKPGHRLATTYLRTLPGHCQGLHSPSDPKSDYKVIPCAVKVTKDTCRGFASSINFKLGRINDPNYGCPRAQQLLMAAKREIDKCLSLNSNQVWMYGKAYQNALSLGNTAQNACRQQMNQKQNRRRQAREGAKQRRLENARKVLATINSLEGSLKSARRNLTAVISSFYQCHDKTVVDAMVTALAPADVTICTSQPAWRGVSAHRLAKLGDAKLAQVAGGMMKCLGGLRDRLKMAIDAAARFAQRRPDLRRCPARALLRYGKKIAGYVKKGLAFVKEVVIDPNLNLVKKGIDLVKQGADCVRKAGVAGCLKKVVKGFYDKAQKCISDGAFGCLSKAAGRAACVGLGLRYNSMGKCCMKHGVWGCVEKTAKKAAQKVRDFGRKVKEEAGKLWGYVKKAKRFLDRCLGRLQSCAADYVWKWMQSEVKPGREETLEIKGEALGAVDGVAGFTESKATAVIKRVPSGFEVSVYLGSSIEGGGGTVKTGNVTGGRRTGTTYKAVLGGKGDVLKFAGLFLRLGAGEIRKKIVLSLPFGDLGFSLIEKLQSRLGGRLGRVARAVLGVMGSGAAEAYVARLMRQGILKEVELEGCLRITARGPEIDVGSPGQGRKVSAKVGGAGCLKLGMKKGAVTVSVALEAAGEANLGEALGKLLPGGAIKGGGGLAASGTITIPCKKADARKATSMLAMASQVKKCLSYRTYQLDLQLTGSGGLEPGVASKLGGGFALGGQWVFTGKAKTTKMVGGGRSLKDLLRNARDAFKAGFGRSGTWTVDFVAGRKVGREVGGEGFKAGVEGSGQSKCLSVCSGTFNVDQILRGSARGLSGSCRPACGGKTRPTTGTWSRRPGERKPFVAGKRPPKKKKKGKWVRQRCRPPLVRNYLGKCVRKCLRGHYQFRNVCLVRCPPGTKANRWLGRCIGPQRSVASSRRPGSHRRPARACPRGQVRGRRGRCRPRIWGKVRPVRRPDRGGQATRPDKRRMFGWLAGLAQRRQRAGARRPAGGHAVRITRPGNRRQPGNSSRRAQCRRATQQVKRARSARIDTSRYYRLTTKWQGAGKSLDIVNDAKKNRLVLAKSGNYSGQHWKFTPVGGGYYRVTTKWLGGGKSLDVLNDRRRNNRPVLAKTGSYSGQMWKLTAVGGGYYRLTTKWQGAGRSLDILNDRRKNDQPILADTCPQSGQLWKLVPVR